MAKFKANQRYTASQAASVAQVTYKEHKLTMLISGLEPKKVYSGSILSAAYRLADVHPETLPCPFKRAEQIAEVAISLGRPIKTSTSECYETATQGRPRELANARDRKRALAIIAKGHKEGKTLQGEINDELLQVLQVSWRTCREMLYDELKKEGIIK